MKIYAKKALMDGAWVENRVVEVKHDEIVRVLPGTEGDVDAEYLTPGLLDKHQHGANGFDCAQPDEEKCRKWLEGLARHGVTNVLYTISTGPVERTRKAMAFARRVMQAQAQGEMPGARVMGVHLEGPFINPVRKGAMNGDYIIEPTMAHFEALTGEDADIVRAMTMAPEMPGALELARELSARGVRLQAGHTDVDCEGMRRAADAGFTGLTHTFNAMPGIGHRAPGPVIAGMQDERLYLEAICDFVHLSPEIVRLLWTVKGPRGITMVSDSVTTAGLPDGEYFGGNHRVIVRNQRNFTTSGGIAGGYRQLDAGVENVVSLGYDLREAIEAARTTPARFLGLSDRLGDIAPGKAACLAAWNEKGQCAFSVVNEHIFRA